MRHRAVLRLVLLAALAPARPALAFDTWWHAAATAAGAKAAGSFSGDAINAMQFGNFFADFYGPIGDTVLPFLERSGISSKSLFWFDLLKPLLSTAARGDALVMHFDNLVEDGRPSLDANWKYDYLWSTLLANTQGALAELSEGGGDPTLRKLRILMVVGSSLHMVQDFYSHSTWTHVDFSRVPASALLATPWNGDRAPTWFEVLCLYPDPEAWWFKVVGGTYPVTDERNPMAHSNIAHDNATLNFGPGLLEAPNTLSDILGATITGGIFSWTIPRLASHDVPPYPARISPQSHMKYALRTASAASAEWILRLMENSSAAAAIDFARAVDLDSENRRLRWHLEGALWAMNFLSCATSHFDGPTPIPEKARLCRGFKKAFGPVVVQSVTPGGEIVRAAYIPLSNALFGQWLGSYGAAFTRGLRGPRGGYPLPPSFRSRLEPCSPPGSTGAPAPPLAEPGGQGQEPVVAPPPEEPPAPPPAPPEPEPEPEPEPAPAAPTLGAGCDAALAATLPARLPELAACGRGPATLALEVAFGADGAVTAAQATGATPEIEACVTAVLRTLRTSQPAGLARCPLVLP